MSLFSEQKLFSVCLEQEKKRMILNALNTELDILLDTQCSEKTIQRYRWLKEEIGKMNVCTNSD
jgi:hypothetical protein